MVRFALYFALILTSAAGLTGCGTDGDLMMRQAAGYDCTAAEGAVGGFFCSGTPENGPALSRYCYKTLGGVNCFDRPDPDRNNQPLGSDG
jgi:hypothetical protein